MTKEEAEGFEALPAFSAILAMRDWDDKAKVLFMMMLVMVMMVMTMTIILAMRDWDDKSKVLFPNHYHCYRLSMIDLDLVPRHHNQLSIPPGPIKAGLKHGTLERDGSRVDGLECQHYWFWF